jgi:hypothetical protein
MRHTVVSAFISVHVIMNLVKKTTYFYELYQSGYPIQAGAHVMLPILCVCVRVCACVHVGLEARPHFMCV